MRSGYSWCSRVAGYEVRVQLVSMELLSPYHTQLLLLFPPGEVHVSQEGLPLHDTGWGTVAFDLESKFAKSSSDDRPSPWESLATKSWEKFPRFLSHTRQKAGEEPWNQARRAWE